MSNKSDSFASVEGRRMKLSVILAVLLGMAALFASCDLSIPPLNEPTANEPEEASAVATVSLHNAGTTWAAGDRFEAPVGTVFVYDVDATQFEYGFGGPVAFDLTLISGTVRAEVVTEGVEEYDLDVQYVSSLGNTLVMEGMVRVIVATEDVSVESFTINGVDHEATFTSVMKKMSGGK